MAASVVYGNFGGTLVHENRSGVKSDYVADALGSVAAVLNTSGKAIYEAEYWPYGEVRTETGSNPSPWSFVGLLGYFNDILNQLAYVRARHYTPDRTQWLTRDPLWPFELPYAYVDGDPILLFDESGTQGHHGRPKPKPKPKPRKCPPGYKRVKVRCYGISDPDHPSASAPIAYCRLKPCGGKPRPPHTGDCAIDQNCPVCKPGQTITILPPGATKPVATCVACDAGQGHCGLDIYINVPDSDCDKHWHTGFYCVKCT